MAGPTALFYSLGLSGLGAAVAAIAALAAWKEVKGTLPRDTRYEDKSTPQGRLLVFLVLPMTLPLFGFAAFFLLSTEPEVMPESAIDWIALAYGVPGLLTGVAEAIVYRRGAAPAFRDPSEWGRIITLSVVPEAAALWGFATSFLLLGFASGFTGPQTVLVDTARNSALFMSLGALGAPVSAILSLTAYDFRRETFLKGLRRGALGTMMMLVGFVLAFWMLASS